MVFSVVCGCPNRTFYANESCLPCPPGCSACFFDHESSSVVCSECVNGTNRNDSSASCECLEGFLESTPALSFCHDKWCASVESNCQNCVVPRVLDANNRCACPPGQFEEKSVCHRCRLRGCLLCDSKSSCSLCDSTVNYYLLGNVCVEIGQF